MAGEFKWVFSLFWYHCNKLCIQVSMREPDSNQIAVMGPECFRAKYTAQLVSHQYLRNSIDR